MLGDEFVPVGASWQLRLMSIALRLKLTEGEVRTFAAVLCHANAAREVTAGRTRIAAYAGLKDRAVASAFSRLIEVGLIERIERHDDSGRQSSSVTRVCQHPLEAVRHDAYQGAPSCTAGVSGDAPPRVHGDAQGRVHDGAPKVVVLEVEEGSSGTGRAGAHDTETGRRIMILSGIFGSRPLTEKQVTAIASADPQTFENAVERVNQRRMALVQCGIPYFIKNMSTLAAEALCTPEPAGPVVIDGTTGAVITTPRPARAATGRAAMGEAIRKRMKS